ncbi:MAG: hypothetical protein Fur0037_06910 [Planctomycetota bacterium]
MLVVAVTVVGYLGFWFLCDDAFITFRYVANAHSGHGLVWNQAPFLPVEGYSCFLWALLLWASWEMTGLEPPVVATKLSLLCGLATLALLFDAARRVRAPSGRPLGLVAAAAVVLGCALNRTFLTFLSSGLETAQFNLVLAWWVALLLRPAGQRSRRWLTWVSLAAALCALSRPDGLLPVAATVAMAGLRWRPDRRGREWLQLLPVLLVVTHLLWRRWFYGAWLPNTYYAKVVHAWPESGLRYLFCYVIEHGTWVWALMLLPWLLRALPKLSPRVMLGANLPAVIATSTLLLHAAYYTMVIGGDHFEYRVYSQLVPWLSLSTAWLASRLWQRPRAPILAVSAMTLMGGFGFWHWQCTRHLGFYEFQPMAAKAPAMLRPLLTLHDRNQAWMQLRLVGVRSRQLDLFCRQQMALFPESMVLPADAGPLPIYRVNAAGVAGYRLRDIALIDALGLNDWVIARAPAPEIAPPLSPEQLAGMHGDIDRDHDGRIDYGELVAVLRLLTNPEKASYLATLLLVLHARDEKSLTREETAQLGESLFPRHMAHERWPPPGYLEDFQPNVRIDRGRIEVTPRRTPLTPSRIAAIEREWRARVRH